jgi:hypothetical protein
MSVVTDAHMDTAAPFRPYLLGNEHILWSGQPKQGLMLTGRDALLIPFSLMWGGFAIFWNAMVWMIPSMGDGQANPGWFFKLWGLPFLVVGLYMIAGRFFHDARIRKTLFYAVTDQRVMMLRGTKITSLDIDRLPRLELSEFRDGTGTVAFEASGNIFSYGWNGFGTWLPSLGGTAEFLRIDAPREIYEMIRNRTRQ